MIWFTSLWTILAIVLIWFGFSVWFGFALADWMGKQ